jgi:hypothetical protein
VEEQAGELTRACALWEQGATTWHAQRVQRIEGWTRLGWAAALRGLSDPAADAMLGQAGALLAECGDTHGVREAAARLAVR